MVNKKGEYEFDSNKLGYAHGECAKLCEETMSNAKPVIVANTLTTEKEVNTYIMLARKYGYTVFSVIIENRHDGVNVHGADTEVLDRMIKRFSIKL